MHFSPLGLRVLLLTGITLCAFAANSLLCRAALAWTTIDPLSFTAIRIVAGALVLWMIVPQRIGRRPAGTWAGAAALLTYAVLFAVAYQSLTTATGALLLFVAVQATMISYGVVSREQLTVLQWAGAAVAMVGLALLSAPGLERPDPAGAVLMLGSGVAWGVYSLMGRRATSALAETTGNFVRAAPMAAALMLFANPRWDSAGAFWALLSGGVASGLGYAVWYAALPLLSPATAATVQLAVPVLAGASGAILLGETLTLRLLAAGATILAGIAMVAFGKR